MKLNKNLLKSIVKECLIEILAEGLVSENNSAVSKRSALKESVNNASRRKVQKRPIENQRFVDNKNSKNGSYLDNISFGNNEEKNTNFNNATDKLVSKVTKDPIMSEIFADTARTTLQEQVESGNKVTGMSKPADQAARIVSQSDPTELFGGAANKWADLAFAPKING